MGRTCVTALVMASSRYAQHLSSRVRNITSWRETPGGPDRSAGPALKDAGPALFLISTLGISTGKNAK